MQAAQKEQSEAERWSTGAKDSSKKAAAEEKRVGALSLQNRKKLWQRN